MKLSSYEILLQLFLVGFNQAEDSLNVKIDCIETPALPYTYARSPSLLFLLLKIFIVIMN